MSALWMPDRRIPGKSRRTAPALAGLGDRLHLVHKGEDTTALCRGWTRGFTG